MQFGVICLFDALGIKEAWKTKARTSGVLKTLRIAADTGAGMKRYVNGTLAEELSANAKLTVLTFSDTLLIAAQPRARRRGGISNSVFLDMVCQVAAYVQRRAAQADSPLVFRGVVTAGDFVVRGTTVLGPAINEAAELYERARGAFVWLSPTAAEIEQPTHSPLVWPTMAHNYAVPLDKGESFHTTALVPFVDTNDKDEWRRILDGYKTATAGTRIDIQVKAQNTWRFLQAVAQARGMGELTPPDALDNPVTV